MFRLKWKKKNFLKKNKLHEMLQTARCRLTLKIMMQTFRLWGNVIIWKMASFFLPHLFAFLCFLFYAQCNFCIWYCRYSFLRAVAAKCICHSFETHSALTQEQTAVKFVSQCHTLWSLSVSLYPNKGSTNIESR